MTTERPILTPAARTRAMIAEVAQEHDVTYADIMGLCRSVTIVRARRAAIIRVATAKPWLSSVQISMIFGRDHSTVLYTLGRLTKRAPPAHPYANNTSPRPTSLGVAAE